jgi:hypothetical protein
MSHDPHRTTNAMANFEYLIINQFAANDAHPGRLARNAIDFKPRLLKQTIEHAPCKCPMRASALQRKIDKDAVASDGGFTCLSGH